MFDTSCYIYSESEPEYYDDDPALPVYERISSKSRRLYSPEQILTILLSPKLQDSNFVCSRVPTCISSSVVFVVDASSLEDKNDLLCDDMGVWKNNGVDTSHYLVKTLNGEVISTEKSSSDEAFTVKRVYRVHGTYNSLKKLTVTVYGM